MIQLLHDADLVARDLVWVGLVLALGTFAAVVVGRLVIAYHQARAAMIARRYGPLIEAALRGDASAERALVRSPSRYRLGIAWLIVPPLIHDCDPVRVASTRRLFRAISIARIADRHLRSPLWWRRAVALRALGLLQDRHYTATIVGALDDPNEDVRGAALDALADLRDPASLTAIVVRLHDGTLHLGRRIAALAAFGSQSEPMLLRLAGVHPSHLADYARALAMCGTATSRPALCAWTADPRSDVRAAAFEALAHVGVDRQAARLAIEALESPDAHVRAMAASALRGWHDRGAATRLATHLDDTWTVAVEAAKALRSMGRAGLAELRAAAAQPGLSGVLARQMVWANAA